MTSQLLPFVDSTKVSFLDRVAELFRSKPNEWIDGRVLAQVGGAYAWRTRVSECRRLRGMTIENRERKHPNGWTISEYRWVP